MNSIFSQDICYVSNYPGKTRELFFFSIANNKDIILIDAPGYGFALGNKNELV